MVEKEQGLERARLTKSRRSKRGPTVRKRGTRSQDPFKVEMAHEGQFQEESS